MKKRIISLILILSIFAVPLMARMDVVIDETILEPKDPILATVLALGPGLLAHGWGHFYAEDYRIGLTLFGLEIVSVVLVTVGFIQGNAPTTLTRVGGNTDEVIRGAEVTILSGVALFAATWIADVLLAGRASEQYNIEHNLEFKMQEEAFMQYTPSIMYTYKF